MPLTLRRENDDPNHYQVYAGKVHIGTIYKAINQQSAQWLWSMNGIMSGPVAFTGFEPSFEAAKAKFKANWEKWVEQAGLREQNSD